MNNGSKAAAKMTAGLDLGDNYSHLCLIDTQSGEEVIEEGLLCVPPQRGHTAPVRFGAAAAHRHRGGNPLALGEPSTRRVRP